MKLTLIEGEMHDCPNTGAVCWFRPNPIEFGKGKVGRRWTDGKRIYVEVNEWSKTAKFSLDKIVWES